MKDFNYYKELQTLYPRKEDYKSYDIVNIDKVEVVKSGLTKEQIKELGYKIPTFSNKTAEQEDTSFIVKEIYDEEGYKSHELQYIEEQNQKTQEFRKDLANEHGIEPFGALDNLIYAKAYEDGHSSGFHEIYNHYSELSDFVEKIQEVL